MRFIAGTIVFLVHPDLHGKFERIKEKVAEKLGFNTDKIKFIAKSKDEKNDRSRSKL